MAKSKFTCDEALATECPHCALSKFLMIYQDHHPDKNNDNYASGAVELLADIVLNEFQHDRSSAVGLMTDLILRVLNDFSDIKLDRYKNEEWNKKSAERQGGLH